MLTAFCRPIIDCVISGPACLVCSGGERRAWGGMGGGGGERMCGCGGLGGTVGGIGVEGRVALCNCGVELDEDRHGVTRALTSAAHTGGTCVVTIAVYATCKLLMTV